MSIPLDYVENNSNNTDYHSNDGDSNDMILNQSQNTMRKKIMVMTKLLLFKAFVLCHSLLSSRLNAHISM